MRPSASMPTFISDGLLSEVLPMPYHEQAMPAPRLMRSEASLNSAAALFQSRQYGSRTSMVSAMPTESSSTWLVMVASPGRNAFSRRNSSQSMPSLSASASMAASLAI